MANKKNEYDKEFLLGALRRMLNIRRFEEMCAQMYGLKKIGGFCHLYNGQEAVAVGSIAALDLKKDYVLTAYRDHAHALVCGMDPKAAMAELYGKATGCSRGKGGSMHLFDVENHMLGGNGIVGAQIPVATGVALAQAYRKDGGVTLVYFGDGAIHQGSFHESLNLARVWNLPIVYIVENNQFGMGTAVHRVSAVENFEVKAQAYNIPGIAIDGMDFVTVYEGVSAAVEKARSEGLPHLLHIKTYRYRGHSMSDPAKYRTKEQVDEYKAQDPILVLKSRMLEAKQLTNKEFDELDKKAKALAKEAAEFAENSEEPSLESLHEDIYA